MIAEAVHHLLFELFYCAIAALLLVSLRFRIFKIGRRVGGVRVGAEAIATCAISALVSVVAVDASVAAIQVDATGQSVVALGLTVVNESKDALGGESFAGSGVAPAKIVSAAAGRSTVSSAFRDHPGEIASQCDPASTRTTRLDFVATNTPVDDLAAGAGKVPGGWGAGAPNKKGVGTRGVIRITQETGFESTPAIQRTHK